MQVLRSRHSYSRISMNPRGVIGKINHMNVKWNYLISYLIQEYESTSSFRCIPWHFAQSLAHKACLQTHLLHPNLTLYKRPESHTWLIWAIAYMTFKITRKKKSYFNLCSWSESRDRINTYKINGTRSAHTICNWGDRKSISTSRRILPWYLHQFPQNTHIVKDILLSSAISPWSGWQTIRFSTSTPNAFEYAGSKACSASTSIAFPPSRCILPLKAKLWFQYKPNNLKKQFFSYRKLRFQMKVHQL